MLQQLISFGIGMMGATEMNQAEWRERIKERYRDTVNLPRKKKKQVRKELQVEWNLANWSPFDNF
jgi:hypothetical protein